jgi:tetratricopeptide (TPR) repeat protein
MKNKVRILLFFLIFIILFISVIEVYLRLYNQQPVFENYTTAKFGIPTAFKRNQLVKKKYVGFPYTLKSGDRNLRNFRKTRYKKPKDIFRVLCIGGSIFAASGVNNDETFASQLDLIFKTKHFDQKFEVINGAKNQWELPEYDSFFRSEGYKYSPDLTIVYFHTGELLTLQLWKYEADEVKFTRTSKTSVMIEVKGLGFNLGLNNFAAQSLKIIQSIPFYDSLFIKSHVLRFVEKGIRKKLTNDKIKKKKRYNFEESINAWDLRPGDSINWKTDYGEIINTSKNQIKTVLYSIGLEKFYRNLHKHGSKLLFLVVPSYQEVLQLEDISNRPKPFLISNSNGLGLLNLVKSMIQFQTNNFTPLNYPGVIHWTPTGHKLAAFITLNFLIEKNLLVEGKSFQKIKISEIKTLLNDSNNRITPILNKQNYNLYLKGVFFKNQYELALAEENLLEYLKEKKNNYEAYYLLGMVYKSRREYSKAINYFKIASKGVYPLKLTRYDYAYKFTILFKEAWVSYKKGKVEESLIWLKQAEMLKGDFLGSVYNLKATIFSQIKNFNKAEFYFKKAISTKPDFSEYYRSLANLYFDNHKYNDAIFNYKKCLNLNSNDVKSYLMIGLSYKQIKKETLGLKWFKKFLSQCANNCKKFLQEANLLT